MHERCDRAAGDECRDDEEAVAVPGRHPRQRGDSQVVRHVGGDREGQTEGRADRTELDPEQGRNHALDRLTVHGSEEQGSPQDRHARSPARQHPGKEDAAEDELLDHRLSQPESERERTGERRGAGLEPASDPPREDMVGSESGEWGTGTRFGQGIARGSADGRSDQWIGAGPGCYAFHVSRSELCSSLLVAMPQLSDPNFRRAVVLVVHHDAESTFGLVLNREVELTVDELCESLQFPWNGERDAEVAWGGPVESNSGWLLFQDSVEMEVADEHVSRLEGSLCFAGSMDVFRQLAGQPPVDLRIFLGYAGWGGGQLEMELAQGAWVVAPLSSDVVFDVPREAMWDHVLRAMDIDPATLISTAGVH